MMRLSRLSKCAIPRLFATNPLGLPSSMRQVHSPCERASPTMTADLSPVSGVDPFAYTSGRWLHRDEAQRKARYLTFDFNLLCRKVLDACPGARQILRYDKKEGSFNRVFIFHMDNESQLVARLPFRVAGPKRLTTNSEVATMSYRK